MATLTINIDGDPSGLSVAVNQSDQHLSKLDKSVKGSSKELDSFGDKFKGLGAKVKDGLGSSLLTGAGLLGIGAGAGAIIAKGMGDALASEDTAAHLGAKLGLSPTMTKAAGKLAGEIYSQNFGESLDDVSGAIALVTRDMGGLGNISKDEFTDITKDALTLKDVFGVELGGEGGVITSVSQLMRNKMAPNAKAALDVITVGLRGPANKAGDLLETFNEYSPLFASLGLDAQTSLGLMNQAVGAGARNSDIAADALKEFSIRARAASDPNTIAGFGALGLSVWDMSHKIAAGGPQAQEALQLTLDKLRGIKDPTEQARIATLLFGTQSEDMQRTLLAFNPATAVGSLGQIEGATNSARSASETHTAKIEEWKRGFETNVSGFIAETGIPALESLQQKWTDNIGTTDDLAHGWEELKLKGEGISQWWSDNIGTAQDFKNGLDMIGGAAQWVGDKFVWLKDKVLDPIIGTFQSITDKWDALRQNELFKGIAGGLTGTTGLAQNAWGWINGARASGGPVKGGGTYLVGERGPELFTAGMSGSIIANGAKGTRGNPFEDGSFYGMTPAEKAAQNYVESIQRQQAMRDHPELQGRPGWGAAASDPFAGWSAGADFSNWGKPAARPAAARAVVSRGAGGGVTVNLTVMGSVATERDIVEATRNGVIEAIRRTGGSPTTYFGG